MKLAHQPGEPILKPVPRQGVERAERLVEDEDGCPADDGPEEAGPLAHPSGELVRVSVLEPGEAERGEAACDLLPPPLPIDTPDLERKLCVLNDRLPGEEEGVLGEVAGAVDRTANLAGVVSLQAEEDPEQGRLPASGRSEDGERLPLVHVERDVPEDGEVTVGLRQPVDLEEGPHSPSPAGTNPSVNASSGSIGRSIRPFANAQSANRAQTSSS